MPTWLRTLVASVVAAAVTFGVAYLAITTLRPEANISVAKADGNAVVVDDAIALDRGARVAVRGYVFLDEEAGALLCSARTNTDDRPACAGSSLLLVGLDTSRLDLEVAEVAKGGYDAWSRSTVVLLGRINRATLTVEDILST